MNQYRCETCDFKGTGMMGDERCPYDVQKTNEDNCDLLYRYKRTTEEKELMDMCGLTCHSDFQSEREKVQKLLDIIQRSQILVDTRQDREYIVKLQKEGKVKK